MTYNDTYRHDLTEEFCIEKGLQIASSWYYRASLMLALTISTVSAGYGIFFLYRFYLKSSYFHSNLRVLFFSLCLSCLLYDLLNITMKVHHLLIPLLATTPCQVFLPKAFYIATNIPFVFVLFASQFIQIAIVIERCIANVYIKDYETGYKKLGPILISAAMSVCVSILLMLYCGENFDGPVLNARALPTKNIVLVNVVIMVMLAINFTGLALTITLHFVGPKRRIRMSLSSKFQSIENNVASDLLFWLSSIQFTIFVITDVVFLFLRIYESKNRMIDAYKENADLFNYYTLILPLLSRIFLVKAQSRRLIDIRNNINIKSVGQDGWMNYSAVTQKYWM